MDHQSGGHETFSGVRRLFAKQNHSRRVGAAFATVNIVNKVPLTLHTSTQLLHHEQLNVQSTYTTCPG